MEISDIIKKEQDRIFIVDPECIIIFTGDSLEDSKPFIRIGNWFDLPVEIIPLIENIIITDKIIGNPAFEQFNIDIQYLPTNRYIGSNVVVNRYLDFQKIFGLNLSNAAIVNVEKDIPDISKSKNISDRNSFIGIFYKNGNFKIEHKGNELFDLNAILEKNYTYDKVNLDIATHAKTCNRYQGSGVIFIDNNPLFYRNNAFTSYLFPFNYYKNFKKLHINPKSIQNIIHPSSNFLAITKFLKFKHDIQDKLSIFSDYNNDLQTIKKLFNKSSLVLNNFKNLSYNSGKGLTIQGFPTSYNLQVTFSLGGRKSDDINIAYVKGFSYVEKLIKQKLDALLVNYSVFEDTNLLFKSCKLPYAIIDDGNKNINKLSKADHLILYQNVQYNFIKVNSDADFLEFIEKVSLKEEIIEKIINQDISFIQSLFANTNVKKMKSKDLMQLLNIISVLRFFIATTSNRKFASKLKAIIQKHALKFNTSLLLKYAKPFTVHLIFSPNGLYEITEIISETTKQKAYIPDDIIKDNEVVTQNIASKNIRSFYEKIFTDRQRLYDLLKLYCSSKSYQKELQELKKAIEKRKEIFQTNEFPPKNKEEAQKVSSLISEKEAMSPHSDKKAQKQYKRELILKRIKALLLMLVILTIIGLLSLFSWKSYKNYLAEKKIEETKAEQQRVQQENKRIEKQYNVHISNRDIFIYANKVAIKNGYAPLSQKYFKKRNPDWIYPGNVFTLLDGERVVVKKGNTLWGISEGKLKLLYIEFYKAIEHIKEKIAKEEEIDSALFNKAESYIFNKKQEKILSQYKKKFPDNGN